jgi:hypothetical protein
MGREVRAVDPRQCPDYLLGRVPLAAYHHVVARDRLRQLTLHCQLDLIALQLEALLGDGDDLA